MHAVSYLLKLQIDDEILGGRGQACPGMLKEAIKTWQGSIELRLLPSGSFYKFQCGGCSTTYYDKIKCHYKVRMCEHLNI